MNFLRWIERLKSRSPAATKQDLIEMEKRIMARIEDVLADIEAETTLIAGVSTLISSLRKDLKDALAGTTLPPATQAKIDAAFAQLETNKAKLAAALVENTPDA